VRRALPALLLVAVVVLGGLAGVVRQQRADAELAAPVPVAAAPEPARAPAATPAPEAPARPRDTFAHTCGMCHALAAARVSGLIGPDLDAVRPSAARVRRAIRTGSLDGVMQPGLLRGREARAMAAYVARVAGRR
jgi:mono/diheme cytochrome c family protein